MRKDAIEFLLVRTRGSGRWTFPKGCTEPGITHAQAAALEAFEEAGVHGRIEEASFARYLCRKRTVARKSAARSEGKEFAVNAHLCEVLRLGKPKESNRDRTWFSVKDARLRLREGRDREDGKQLARVADKAAARIRRLHNRDGLKDGYWREDRATDALQKVQFEAVAGASFIPPQQRALRQTQSSYAPDLGSRGGKLLTGEVLEFTPAEKKRSQSLGIGPRNP
jgi:8-oxo-dGTP pyrophosphatase MutT (NUDIX family)